VIPTLPLRARNRLAELVLAALADPAARRELAAIANAPGRPADWALEDEARLALVTARARAATQALAGAPALAIEVSLADALHAAAILFDAGLGFETHEVLEPHWRDASGAARDSLQGLIQVAVGYQHLANGNVEGARALRQEGAARLEAGGLGLDLGSFRAAVLASPTTPPRFPRAARAA
jgi:uncharacterized protein RhaS with RHS repeats